MTAPTDDLNQNELPDDDARRLKAIEEAVDRCWLGERNASEIIATLCVALSDDEAGTGRAVNLLDALLLPGTVVVHREGMALAKIRPGSWASTAFGELTGSVETSGADVVTFVSDDGRRYGLHRGEFEILAGAQ